jgi:hypothetical protein
LLVPSNIPDVLHCSLLNIEARNQHRNLLRRLGATGDALWIIEFGHSLAERNRGAIWRAVNVPGEEASASRDSFPLASRAVRMVVRV